VVSDKGSASRGQVRSSNSRTDGFGFIGFLGIGIVWIYWLIGFSKGLV
jgi:hypothetical protein